MRPGILQAIGRGHATNVPDARSHLERYRMELGAGYIDILLLHRMTKEGWPAENQGAMEYLIQAKQDKIIRAHGTSCHGMDLLRTPPRLRSWRRRGAFTEREWRPSDG